MDKKHQEIIISPDGFKNTDSLVGVRDNGDGSYTDLRFSAAQILAFVNGSTFVSAPVLEDPEVEDSQATINGSNVAGADYYQVQISTNSNFTGASSVNTVTWPKVINGLINGTLYYFRSRTFIGSASSDWSNTVSVTPQAVTPTISTPSVTVTANDGLLTVVVSQPTGGQLQIIEISDDDFATIANDASGDNDGAPVDIAATNGTAYKVRAKVTGAGYNDSAYGYASGTYTPSAQLNAYWVANDDGHIPTELEFQAGTAIPITSGQTTITFDITAQTTDRFVFFAEPIGEPEKTYKYAAALDQENLGNDGQFNVGVDLTTLRYYPSNYPTSNATYPIQLKTVAGAP